MDSFVEGSTGNVWAVLPTARGLPPTNDSFWNVANAEQVSSLFGAFGVSTGGGPGLNSQVDSLLDAWGRLEADGSTFLLADGSVGRVYQWWTKTGVPDQWLVELGATPTIEPQPQWTAPALVHLSPAPEPATAVLMLVGLAAAVLLRRFTRR